MLRGGFGIYYGPGQTEDQIQPIESNRISSTLSNVTFPQDPVVIAAAFLSNPNNRQYQPRAYAPEYTIPEKVYQYSVSVQQALPYKMVLTAAFVGSQGRNLFLRSVANRILPGQTSIAGRHDACLSASALSTEQTQAGRLSQSTRSGSSLSFPARRQCKIRSPRSTTRRAADTTAIEALQMSLAGDSVPDLTLNSQYTFSRSFGNTSGSNEARTAANNARASE